MNRDKVIRQLLDERIALMAYINTIVRDRHHAEDLFQDLSVEAVDKAETIQDSEHFTRWLRTAARFRAIDFLRSKTSRSMVFDPELIDKLDAAWQAHASQATSQRVEALRDCLSRLPKRTQTILELRYKEELSGDELAQQTGRSANAIYLALSRVHKALRLCVEERLNADDSNPRGGETR